jgi:hypothetical protein
MRKTQDVKRYDAINIKIPEPLVKIIDANLVKGKALNDQGFDSRAHFVETAVVEQLFKLNLLDKKLATGLAERRQVRKKGRHDKKEQKIVC